MYHLCHNRGRNEASKLTGFGGMGKSMRWVTNGKASGWPVDCKRSSTMKAEFHGKPVEPSSTSDVIKLGALVRFLGGIANIGVDSLVMGTVVCIWF